MKRRSIRITTIVTTLATIALATGASVASAANQVVTTLGMRW